MNQTIGGWYELRLDQNYGGGFLPFFGLNQPVHETGARPFRHHLWEATRFFYYYFLIVGGAGRSLSVAAPFTSHTGREGGENRVRFWLVSMGWSKKSPTPCRVRLLFNRIILSVQVFRLSSQSLAALESPGYQSASIPYRIRYDRVSVSIPRFSGGGRTFPSSTLPISFN